MGFKEDIEKLVAQVPVEAWKDRSICGLLYDIFPWHGYSSLSLQTRQCDEYDPASWKYFEISKSKGEFLKLEFSEYNKSPDALVYHLMLFRAAEALLEVDFGPYNAMKTVSNFHLSPLFRLQVLDPDKTFTSNYCEFVLVYKIHHAPST
jgi:hypothetical protein